MDGSIPTPPTPASKDTKDQENLQRPPAPQEDKDFSPRTALIVVGVFVLLGAIGLGLLWHRNHNAAIRKDQIMQADTPKFQTLESEMQSAYRALVGGAGEPAKQGQDKSCAADKAATGDRRFTCTIAYNLIYGVADGQAGRELSLKISDILTKQQGFAIKPESPTFAEMGTQIDKAFTTKVAMVDSAKVGNCEIALAYNSSSLDLYKGIDEPYVADYFFTCSRTTAKPIYTLAK